MTLPFAIAFTFTFRHLLTLLPFCLLIGAVV